MGSTYSGTLQFRRDQQFAIVDLSYAPSLTGVQTFASVVHTLTTADIARCAFTESIDPQLIGPGGTADDLNYGAMFQFRRANGGDPRYVQFRVPAPRTAMLELVTGRGYKIKDSYGETLAAAFSALRGEPLTFERGWLVH